jgi:hypothetical protein
MLPHVDDFLPVHNLESLTELAAALSLPRAHRAVGLHLKPAKGNRAWR